MFDLEQEDREDDAARCIQRCGRTYNARQRLKHLIRSNFIKKYDRVNDRHYYKNKTTGEILQDKPRCLGSDDLPNPREFVAPEYYEVGDEDEQMPTGFALVVLNNVFQRSEEKIESLEPYCWNEFEDLKDILPHDFICRFSEENTYILNNCKVVDIKDAMERLRSVVKKKHFFVMYFCTHVVTIVKGEKKNPSETTYFAMKDSIWTKPEEMARTFLSLTDLARMVNRIPTKRKTMIVNCAHKAYGKKPFFAPVKKLYPPSDFLARLADKANCAVIASNVIGTSMSETLRHHPHKHLLHSQKGDKKSKSIEAHRSVKEKNDEKKDGTNENYNEKESETEKKGDDGADEEEDEEDKLEGEEDDEYGGDQRNYDEEDFQTALGGGINHHQMMKRRNKLVAVVPKTPTQVLVEEYLSTWKIPPDPELKISDRPSRPLPTWTKDEESNFEYAIQMPETQDENDYFYAMLDWRLKSVFGPPANWIKKQWRKFQRSTMNAPLQTSLHLPGDATSLFGHSLIKGLCGGACKPTKKYVTALHLFEYISEHMVKRLEEYKANIVEERLKRIESRKEEAEATGTEYIEESEDSEKALQKLISIHQSPAFFVPVKNPKAAKNPVCLRCGPPAPPERPYIIRTGISEIELEWYNQEFDGIPPEKYKIEICNRTRVYSTWRECPSPRAITTTRFTVRDLPIGVPCQFRVSAYNNGGWSKVSMSSQMTTPGDELTPLPTRARWRRIIQGGPLASIDIMAGQPMNRDEHIRGLRMLIVFAQNDHGFTRGVIQLKAAHAAVHALMTFMMDPEMAKLAFMVLGWTTRPESPGVKKVRIYLRNVGITKISEEYMEEFRLNGDVLKAITWLRDGMPRNPEGPGHIPPPPPYIIPADKDEIDEDDDELQEQLAIEEDIRLAEEKIRLEQEEIEAAKRAAKKAEEDRKKKELEELQAKKEAKWLEEMKAEADKASRP